MGELFLPVLSHFQNENIWVASAGKLRYKVTPGAEDLKAEIWEGPWCYELSAVETEARFPLTDGGIEELRAWLLAQAEEMNARPGQSLAEALERRERVKGEREAAAEADK